MGGSLAGRTAVVTGASRGIGREIAVALAGAGARVVLAARSADKRPLRGRSPYAASKLALVGLVRTLAAEAGRYGVRVNLASPGPVDGDRLAWVIRANAQTGGMTPEEASRALVDASPLGRLVPGADVAQAVLFLASDAAGSITGEDLNVSGGVVMY